VVLLAVGHGKPDGIVGVGGVASASDMALGELHAYHQTKGSICSA
jgi:hypothetical protein